MPPDARFCPACGARGTPVAAVEVRKLVTVVFCDLVGSTPLSEALDPETLRAVILRYFEAMRGSIERFGGTVEKFIGDAVMAVFGVPVMHEDDARRAAAAALDMLDALADLNADLEPTLGVRLRVRIGVHTGPAVTSVDVSTRQAMVSGDTVNIAARLEQNAGEGEILIGPVTREAIGSARVETVGPLRLKGKEAPLVTYRLLGIGEDDPETLRRFDLPFVGRRAELAVLDNASDAVASGSGSRLLTVCGEPGIGKTRLLRAWLDGTGSRYVHGAGRCRPYGEQGSLEPLADVVHRLLATPAGRRAGEGGALAVLEAGLLRDGTPGASLDGTCAALARLLERLSRQRTVVVVLDDCHWASDLTLEVVDRLLAMTERSAVLFLCAARLEILDRRPDWGATSGYRLVLSGLSAAECELMIDGLVEVGAHMSAGAAPAVLAAGGNPFYLEQLFAAVGDTGLGELPHSLQSLLGARIDALDTAERTTLDLAAVFGREFAPYEVNALAGAGPEGRQGGPLAADGEGDRVRAALLRLDQRRLIAPADPPAPDGKPLRFSNGLVHEATYQAMAKRTRADRHERAASVLAGWHAAIATVASHLEHAYRYRFELGLRDEQTEELRRRAARLLNAAGSQALMRSDLAWAGALFERAVDLFVAGEPGWAAGVRQLGEITVAGGRADEGRALLRTVLESSSEPVQTAHARLALAVADRSPAAGTVAAVARETLPVFTAVGDGLGQARARIRMAQERQLTGRHGEADELLNLALADAVRCDAEPERALALGAAAISLWRGPTPVPEAVARCRKLLAEHGSSRPTVRVTLSCPLAVLLALDGDCDAARTHLAEARGLADELGYAEGRMVIPIFEAAVESLAGQPDGALRLLDRAATVASELAADGLLSTIAREAARVLLDQGRAADAATRLEAVTDTGRLLPPDLADLDGLRGRLAAGRGDVEEAIDLTDGAVSAAATTDSTVVQAIAALDRAATLQELGRTEPAAAAAQTARSLFEGKGHRPGVAQAARLLARIGGEHKAVAEPAGRASPAEALAPEPRLTWRLRDHSPDDIAVTADGERLEPEWAWGGATGDGVRVCVVDSGVAGDHPMVGPVAGAWVVVEDDGDYTVEATGPHDPYGHGTACAGIIRRAAPGCELYSVRVLGERGSGSGGMLLAGLRWAVRHDVDIINMSLSTTKVRFVEELRSLADEAFFRRTVIVASAHNSPVESFPWRFASVISVGSHHQEGNPELFLYNPQPPVEFFAPGQNVEVAWPGGGTIRSTGNSFATPFIAGLCARILSKHPRMTTFQLKNALYLSAANVRIATGGTP
jgi:class 3 adenylate cyclase/subtilisin family serine protease